MPFFDRAAAGRQLAVRLAGLRGQDVVVLGLPRGGVVVAAEVAAALGVPLDVVVVRKVGVPFQPELAMGAVGEGGVRVLNEDVVWRAGISGEDLGELEALAAADLSTRADWYREGRDRIPVKGRTAIVVDDGIATGATARAACAVVRAEGAARVVLAVPVAPPDWAEHFAAVADDLVCLETPREFFSVGRAYARFPQVTDGEAAVCLAGAAQRAVTPTGSCAPGPLTDVAVEVHTGGVRLPGHLAVPVGASGVVVFAHGSGSSRRSPRNRSVADALHRAGLGTLLFDLLTSDEELDRANVFDTALLARRLAEATTWLSRRPDVAELPTGWFGASTGAAAALWAAADPDAQVAAVVCRGGRPDLAAPRLHAVTAPTLLIVGGRDELVLELNRRALAQLHCESRLDVVPGATHLFEEPGALDQVAALAGNWFADHLNRSLG